MELLEAIKQDLELDFDFPYNENIAQYLEVKLNHDYEDSFDLQTFFYGLVNMGLNHASEYFQEMEYKSLEENKKRLSQDL